MDEGITGGKQDNPPSLSSDGRAHKRTQLNALGGPLVLKGEAKPMAPKGKSSGKRKRSEKKGSTSSANQSITTQLDALFGALLDGSETVPEGAVEARELILQTLLPDNQGISDWEVYDEEQDRIQASLKADAEKVFESSSDEPDSGRDDPMHTPDKMDEEQSSNLLSDVTNSNERNGDDTLMANVNAEATIAPDFGHTTAPAALGSTVQKVAPITATTW